MRQIVLRKLRKDELAAISILFTLGFLLCEGLMFSLLPEDWFNPPKRLFDLMIMLFIALFFCGSTVLFVCDSRKYICITEDAVTLMSGKRVVTSIPKDKIIAYGVFSQYEKHIPGFPFFCHASVSEVSAVAQKYWHWRKRIYRKKQLDELEATPEGIWTLQMSIYIYWERFRLERNRKYISVNRISKEELHDIWKFWQRKPMLLGPMALYFPWRYL